MLSMFLEYCYIENSMLFNVISVIVSRYCLFLRLCGAFIFEYHISFLWWYVVGFSVDILSGKFSCASLLKFWMGCPSPFADLCTDFPFLAISDPYLSSAVTFVVPMTFEWTDTFIEGMLILLEGRHKRRNVSNYFGSIN